MPRMYSKPIGPPAPGKKSAGPKRTKKKAAPKKVSTPEPTFPALGSVPTVQESIDSYKIREKQKRPGGPAGPPTPKGHYKRLHNKRVYEGKAKPKTKREKELAQRGYAIRKILSGSAATPGKTPFQSIKQTGKVREAKLAEVERSLKNVEENLEKKKLDPRRRRNLRSKAVALRSEADRLEGRKKRGEVHKIKKALDAETKSVEKINKEITRVQRAGADINIKELNKLLAPKVKRAKQLERIGKKKIRQSKKDFKRSQERAVKASKIHTSIKYLPKAKKGTLSKKELKELRSAFHKGPFALPKFTRTKRSQHMGKGPLYQVPSQDIPDDEWRGKYGGGLYTSAEIQALGNQAEKAAKQPSALQAGLVAAELGTAAIGPEILLGKALIRGAKAATTVNKLGDVVEPVGRSVEIVLGKRSAEEVARRMVAKAKASTLVSKVRNISSATKTRVADVIVSPINRRLQSKADDIRVISGGGEQRSIDLARAEEALRATQNFKRSKGRFGTGLGLRVKRGAIAGGVTVTPVAIGSAIDSDFRNAALRDAHDLVVGFVPSTVQLLTASGDALMYGTTGGGYGSTSRIEKMWKEMMDTSPMALALQGRFDEAWSQALERPVSTSIELAGAYGATGRTLGAAARELPPSLTSAGSIAGRRPIEVYGDIRILREYSGNIFTKGFQVMGEKIDGRVFKKDVEHTVKRGVATTDSLIDELASINRGQEITMRVEKAADEDYARMVIGERANLAQAEKSLVDVAKRMRKNFSKPQRKVAPHMMTLIGMGIVRTPKTAIADIRKLRDDIAAKHAKRDSDVSPKTQRQEETLDVLDSLLEHEDMLESPAFWDAHKEFYDLENVRQDELIGVGALNEKAKEFAPWIPYAVNHMGARFNENTKRFTINGKKIGLKDIVAHARANGMEHNPVMVTTRRLDGGDAGNYEFLNQPSADTYRATGQAIVDGTFDASFTALMRQAGVSRKIIDKRRAYQAILDKAGFRVQGEATPFYFLSKEEAQGFADRTTGTALGLEMTPVNLKTFIADMEQLAKTDMGKLDAKAVKNFNEDIGDTLQRALSQESVGGDSSWVLVPKVMLDRLKKHDSVERSLNKVIRGINREFKGSVLAFNPKWHMGNIADMAMRLYFEGAFSSYGAGIKLLNEVKKQDPLAYNDLLSMIGSGFLSHGAHDLADFTSKEVRTFDAYASAQRRALTSAIRLGGRAYREAQRGSFGAAQKMEYHLRAAALGKAARQEAQRLGAHWDAAIKMQPEVVTDLAKGLIEDSSTISKYVERVNRVMGDYSTMSPEFRFGMLSFAPFLLWARASTKFVLTLPAKSPVRTAMVTSVNRLNEDERRLLGLSVFKPKAERLPDYMLGSLAASSPFGDIPDNEVEELFRTNAYTSFGPLTDFAGLAHFMFPQFWSLAQGFASAEDWTGKEIVNRDGSPITHTQRVGIMLNQALETYVAPIAIGHKLIAKGDPSMTYTPFRFTKPPWEGITDRKVTKEKGYGENYGKEVVVEAPEYPFQLSATEGILAKTFSPGYKSKNLTVLGRQSKRQFELEDSEEYTTQNKEYENLFGTQPSRATSNDKRLTKKVEDEYKSLFGK